MSVYGINKVSHLLQEDPAFRARLAEDPATAIADLPLDDAERRELLGGDMAALYRRGAHTFLLSRIPRFAPTLIDRATYIESMRTLLTPEELSEVAAATARAAGSPPRN